MTPREQNRRIKAASRALTAAGQKVGSVEIGADGSVRLRAGVGTQGVCMTHSIPTNRDSLSRDGAKS